MTERTSGLRSVLSSPAVYATFQRCISRPAGRRIMPNRYLSVTRSTRLLDIGCANGRFLEQLSEVDYVGFDPSASYIAAARESYGDRGTFYVGTSETIDCDSVGTFDYVVARGVLHHINDDEAVALAQFASSVLRPEGRLVTLDPCRIEPQRRLARLLVDRDRGQNVRTPDSYADLVRSVFPSVSVDLHQNLLRVPYDHAVVVAQRE